MDEYISKKAAIIAVTRDGCTANVVGVLYHLPTADVVPRNEFEIAVKEVDRLSQVVLYNDSITEMKVEEAKTEVAREIFEEIEKLLKSQEAETENKRLKEVADWIFHDYLPTQFAKLKKKYTEEKV